MTIKTLFLAVALTTSVACEFKTLEPGLESSETLSSVTSDNGDCLAPWGETVKNNDRVEAWMGFASSAKSETRYCKNGELSGTFSFKQKQNYHPLRGSTCNYRNGGFIREDAVGSSCAVFKASAVSGTGSCLGYLGGRLAQDAKGNDLCHEFPDRDRPDKKCYELYCNQTAENGIVSEDGKCKSLIKLVGAVLADQPLDCQGDENSNCNPADTDITKYSKPLNLIYAQHGCNPVR